MSEHRCIHDGKHRKRVIEMALEVVGGMPVNLVRAVEVKECVVCDKVLSKKIPDLQNLIAAMAITRVTDPLKLSGADIRFLRKAMNWTSGQLASALGVALATVSRWENSKDLIGLPNEKLLRLIVGATMEDDAPAIDFDAQQITKMRIVSVRAAEDMQPMGFERVRFKRPEHPKEDQWDTHTVVLDDE